MADISETRWLFKKKLNFIGNINNFWIKIISCWDDKNIRKIQKNYFKSLIIRQTILKKIIF